MKKILIALVLFLIPMNVFAEGSVSVSPSNLTIEVGSSKTFTISFYNTIGDATITSSNASVASVNTSYWATGTINETTPSPTFTITVTAKKVGTATINIVLDGATFDEESISGQTRRVNVNVVAKSSPKPSTPSSPITTNTPQTNKTTDNKSSNCELKELNVENQKVEKVDVNNYKLTVGYAVDNINVSAKAKDTKTKVTGTGNHKLNIGENNIEIVLTAENGAKRIIYLKVTRKDGYYINDLDAALKDNKSSNINITIKEDDKVTTTGFNKIVESKKEVNLNYYDSNKKNIYSWIINGNKANEYSYLDTNIKENTDNNNKMIELSNYADGIYLKTKQDKDIPKGTKIKYYVGNKYNNNDKVNIYCYIDGKLQVVKKGIIVENGYITFDAVNTSDYLITKSNISNLEDVKVEEKSTFKTILPILIVFIVIIIGTFFFLLRKQNKKEETPIIEEVKQENVQ